jgi:hypothetical protein
VFVSPLDQDTEPVPKAPFPASSLRSILQVSASPLSLLNPNKSTNARAVLVQYQQLWSKYSQMLDDYEYVKLNPDQFENVDETRLSNEVTVIQNFLDSLKNSASNCVNDIHSCQLETPQLPNLDPLPTRKVGSITPTEVRIPNWTGLSQQVLMTSAGELGLTIRWLGQDDPRHFPREAFYVSTGEGSITPPPGTTVHRGDTVTIIGRWQHTA